MAYPPAPQYPQPQPSEPKVRPGSVTAVVVTQLLTAVLLIVTGIAMFAVQSAVKDVAVDEILSDPELQNSGITANTIETFITATFALIAGVYLVFAVFYIVLALLNNRGARPARILSWILSGIALACCGIGGLIGQAGSTMTATIDDTQYQDEMTKAIEDATPSWVSALDWITIIAFIAGSLVIIILLAVPASNEFFRKGEPAGPYPGQSPYGQQPGQPPHGQQPPYGQQPPPPPGPPQA
ncbi:hypothetical protein [Glycomyces sp. NRRL B-16210]|uniref:hypothetical protein n=1 Tax=Glycomyces sp. NRRL B-16210 TaxID=1463821 RepID=UPI00068FCE2F|nr:hypothetical protein [Glycomyces sp. NRRL B-16210]